MQDTCTCEEFKKALESGTDNEGYMPAITLHHNDNTKYEIGIVENPIKFCPWCGKKIPPITEKEPI